MMLLSTIAHNLNLSYTTLYQRWKRDIAKGAPTPQPVEQVGGRLLWHDDQMQEWRDWSVRRRRRPGPGRPRKKNIDQVP